MQSNIFRVKFCYTSVWGQIASLSSFDLRLSFYRLTFLDGKVTGKEIIAPNTPSVQWGQYYNMGHTHNKVYKLFGQPWHLKKYLGREGIKLCVLDFCLNYPLTRYLCVSAACIFSYCL